MARSLQLPVPATCDAAEPWRVNLGAAFAGPGARGLGQRADSAGLFERGAARPGRGVHRLRDAPGRAADHQRGAPVPRRPDQGVRAATRPGHRAAGRPRGPSRPGRTRRLRHRASLQDPARGRVDVRRHGAPARRDRPGRRAISTAGCTGCIRRPTVPGACCRTSWSAPSRTRGPLGAAAAAKLGEAGSTLLAGTLLDDGDLAGIRRRRRHAGPRHRVRASAPGRSSGCRGPASPLRIACRPARSTGRSRTSRGRSAA